jgi:hypothetical protein
MNAADSNSGVVAYYYAIGTTPGDSDFVAWTNNGSATAFSNPVTLIAGQWYYISLRAENGAGLISVTDSSDGQVADLGLNIAEQSVRWRCYPNPAVNAIYLDGAGVKPDWVRISDVAGRIVPFKQESAQGQLRIDLSGLASGEYLLQVCSGEKISVMKFIKE